ncbi:hypothetical protein BX600DRAFT_167245 [Xylariales sp. PMI_506]|nr:hypothetical protein BX600DRAFT_167245 [Xylariales sp. PMI_506]
MSVWLHMTDRPILRILQYNVRNPKTWLWHPYSGTQQSSTTTYRNPGTLDKPTGIQQPQTPYLTSSLSLPPREAGPPGVAFYINKRLDQSHISFTSHSSHLATIAITYKVVKPPKTNTQGLRAQLLRQKLNNQSTTLFIHNVSQLSPA